MHTARAANTRTFPYDLAISAVPYDAALVRELSTLIDVRLRAPAIWQHDGGGEAEVGRSDVLASSPLHADASRVVVLLHQRLWGHDPVTRLDGVTLRERLEHRPDTVCVVTLDAEPLPSWLEDAPRCDLTELGTAAVAELIVKAIGDGGGWLHAAAPVEPPTTAPERAWREGPPPFLAQPRAFSTLRRELDALAVALTPTAKPKKSEVDQTIELQTLPNRLVLRMKDVGISFSWVAGRMGTVADGRLLVMQWEGATPHTRGVGSLRFATAVRECVYRPESDGPERWWWRADLPNGRACSTAHLAAEWMAAASMESPVADAAEAP
jgi:hypothetical protein